MDLKQQLIEFGCGAEFVDIALGYAQFYKPQTDIETFVEYVEEVHAKVEETEEIPNIDQEIINTSGVIEVIETFEDEEA